MTLREYINLLEDIAKEEGDHIEVVSLASDTPYTPVIACGPYRDGNRYVTVA